MNAEITSVSAESKTVADSFDVNRSRTLRKMSSVFSFGSFPAGTYRGYIFEAKSAISTLMTI